MHSVERRVDASGRWWFTGRNTMGGIGGYYGWFIHVTAAYRSQANPPPFK